MSQLERASTSVVANIAEGAGEFSRPEKARFHRMARRSLVACLDITRQLKEADADTIERTTDACDGVVAMLVRLIKSLRL